MSQYPPRLLLDSGGKFSFGPVPVSPSTPAPGATVLWSFPSLSDGKSTHSLSSITGKALVSTGCTIRDATFFSNAGAGAEKSSVEFDYKISHAV